MGSGLLFGAGLRFLMDQDMRYKRAGVPVYLRIKNFNDSNADYVQLGFQIAPTGGQDTGFQMVPIDPPPQVRPVSLHNIGVNQTRLHFGAYTFVISHSFVITQMQTRHFLDPRSVWYDPTTVGIVYDNKLFDFVSITHDDVAGEILNWNLICNANDRSVSND